MIKCQGCGAYLQTENETKEGYTKNINNPICERCFQITHYNKYQNSNKTNEEYLKIINEIKKTNDLVLVVSDFLNIQNIIDMPNPKIFILTKRDIIPRGLEENKILDKIKIEDKVIVCAKNNYNLDKLYDMIMQNKTSKNVYIIGYTNAGKSTLINKMIYNYAKGKGNITTSILPSTTLNLIENKINDNLILIDTPGLLDEGNIILKVSEKEMKKILPNKEIRPISFNIKAKQTIKIDKYLSLTLTNNNITIYMSNALEIKRIYKETKEEKTIHIEENQDLVIKGLGFIRFKKEGDINLSIYKDVTYFTRNTII